MAKHIALSYSRLSNYEQCPRQFKAKYITKTYPDDSDNPHFVRGNRIHGALEEAVNNKILDKPQKDVSIEVQDAMPIINSIFTNFHNIYPEQQIAVDSNFNKVDWFSKSAYYRAIFDLSATRGSEALLVDWKTGKVREYDAKPTGQLHLSAAILMSIREELTEVTCSYLFVDHRHSIKHRFTRDDLEELKQPFIEASKVVNSDKEFLPRKNQYCFFCQIDPEECEHKKAQR